VYTCFALQRNVAAILEIAEQYANFVSSIVPTNWNVKKLHYYSFVSRIDVDPFLA